MSSGLRVLKADDLVLRSIDDVTDNEAQIEAAYERGRAQGMQDALAAQREESALDFRDAARTLAAATDDVALAGLRADTEAVVDIAIDLALWVCRDALSVPGNLGRRAAELLDEIDDGVVCLRVADEVASKLSEHLPPSMPVTGDPALSVGDIVIERENSATRLLLEQALERSRPTLVSMLRGDEEQQ